MAVNILEKIFKAIASNRRLQILGLLSRQKELSVGSIAHRLKMPVKTTSFHLLKLENVGLVKKRSENLWMYYSLDLDRLKLINRHIAKIFNL